MDDLVATTAMAGQDEPLTPQRQLEAWREVEDRYGFPFEFPDISARAVLGMALGAGQGAVERGALEEHMDAALLGVANAAVQLHARPATSTAAHAYDGLCDSTSATRR